MSNALDGAVGGHSQPGICVTIDRKDGYDDDDMKDDRRRGRPLRAIAADQRRVNGESIGLLAFRQGGAERFRQAIERAMRTPEGTTIWYLRVIHHLAQKGEVSTLDIRGEEWGEVDFPQDVEAARALVERWDRERDAAAA